MTQNIISFEPLGGDLYNVVYTQEPTIINPKMQTELLAKLFQKEPYNFEAALELASRYATAGDHELACEVRFRAADEAIEALPEDDEYFELEWESEENQEFIEIIVASGTDFFMHGDFEMAAAIYETILALDSDDHCEVSSQLAFSYLAIKDWEGYDTLRNNFSPGSMIESLLENFAAFRQGRKAQTTMPDEMRAEIISTDHPVDDAFFLEADKERVSREVAAREIWYKYMPVFEMFPEFVAQFKK